MEKANQKKKKGPNDNNQPTNQGMLPSVGGEGEGQAEQGPLLWKGERMAVNLKMEKTKLIPTDADLGLEHLSARPQIAKYPQHELFIWWRIMEWGQSH